VDFVIGAMVAEASLWRRDVGKLFKGGELGVYLGEGLLQHEAVAGIGGLCELLGEALAGEEEAVTFPVKLLLFGRKLRARGVAMG